jgi:predicted RNA-binding Zn-ribbon protein involved in translation (DUF1610 family)
MYSNAVGGIKVVVREEDYDDAADILDFPAEESSETAEPTPPIEATETIEGDESPRCPACGLATITALPKMRVFVALAVLVAAVGIAVKQLDLAAVAVAAIALVVAATPRHRCTSCGEAFSWEAPRVAESPLPQDLVEEHCPRCGSPEIHRINYRRFKSLTLFQPLFLLAALWPFLPSRKCDNCGLSV